LTNDPASAVPRTFGRLLLDGEPGLVEVSPGFAGGVASRRIVTDRVVSPPALLPVQLSEPFMSVVTVTGGQLLVTGESGSVTVQVTVTSVRYQPPVPLGAGGSSVAVTVGGVASA
jgi:hypothetical protein